MLNYILILGGIQGLLLALIILVKAKHVANRFLAVFVSLLGLGCLLDNHLNLVEEVQYMIIWVGNAFLFAPLLYLYVKHAVTNQNLSRSTALHVFSFLLVKALVLYSYFNVSLEEPLWVSIGMVLNYGLIAFNFVYLYFSYRTINLSSERRDTYPKSLILTLIGVYTAYNIVFLVRRIVDQFGSVEISVFENYLYLGVALLIYIISALIIYYPNLLKLQNKYSKSAIGVDKLKQYGSELEYYLKTEKPFLTEDFSLGTISTQMGLQNHQVSQVISQYFNLTFYELINQYRIEEFCDRLKEGEHKQKSLLGIAMDCGFKSKSTFNAAFKRLKQVSPSEYVKQL